MTTPAKGDATICETCGSDDPAVRLLVVAEGAQARCWDPFHDQPRPDSPDQPVMPNMSESESATDKSAHKSEPTPPEGEERRVIEAQLANAHDALIRIEKFAADRGTRGSQERGPSRHGYDRIVEMARDGLFTEVPDA